MNKVLLSGLAVVLLSTLLPIILPLLSPILGGLDMSWLSDGNITLGELVAFVGAILIAFSNQARTAFSETFGAKRKR